MIPCGIGVAVSPTHGHKDTGEEIDVREGDRKKKGRIWEFYHSYLSFIDTMFELQRAY